MLPWHLVELEENPNIACIKWQQMFLGIVDYRAPCKRRRVGNVARLNLNCSHPLTFQDRIQKRTQTFS